MDKKILIPQGISALRLAALPLFLYLFSIGASSWCIVVFGLAQISDLIDGYAARKLNATSKLGGYFDAATDFVFIMGIFGAFTVAGYYPFWIMLLISACFGQFIITGLLYPRKLYDPLGKYIGSVLYIAIGLTLLWPTAAVFTLVEVAFPVFAAAAFTLRLASFTHNYRRGLMLQKNNLKQPQPHTV